MSLPSAWKLIVCFETFIVRPFVVALIKTVFIRLLVDFADIAAIGPEKAIAVVLIDIAAIGLVLPNAGMSPLKARLAKILLPFLMFIAFLQTVCCVELVASDPERRGVGSLVEVAAVGDVLSVTGPSPILLRAVFPHPFILAPISGSIAPIP